MMPISYLSPAKLNLFLHINGRRPDGYHELQTYFQLLDWYDLLLFQPLKQTNQIQFTSSDPLIQHNNLVERAANAMLAHAKILDPKMQVTGMHIHLQKNLPYGAGIGSGSSNAGTCLKALNDIWQLAFPNAVLNQLATPLGADVPLFALNQSAFASGIGETLTPFRQTTYQAFVLILPACAIETKMIFCHPDLTRDSKVLCPADLIATLASADLWQNDCTTLVRQLYPEIDHLFEQLAQLPIPQVLLTGTGSTLFIPASDWRQASDYQRQIQQAYPEIQTQVVQSL